MEYKDKTILKFTIGIVILVIACVALGERGKGFKTHEYFTIERQKGTGWELSKLNLPDTTITDTVNIDGVITYHPTQYIRVLKK